MVLYLKLTQKTWARGDFSSDTNFDLDGKVYDDNTLGTTRDISGFTGTFRLIDQEGKVVYGSTANLTLNSNGTFIKQFSNTDSFTRQGSFKVRLRLEVSGTRVTAVGVNGSDELYIEHD